MFRRARQRSQRLFHTLSYLRPQQLSGQLWSRAQRLWRRWLTLPAPGPLPTCRWHHQPPQPPLHWPPPGTPTAPSRDNPMLQGRFTFVNETQTLGWPPQWEASAAPLLWQYNLHYFDWIWSLAPEDAWQAVADWCDAGAPGTASHTGWSPYPTSLRLLNWCGYFFVTHSDWLRAHPHEAQRLWESLHAHAEWLCRHVEHHLMGNHLFENAVALALVGGGFEGADAARWLARGEAILAREIPEQILPDGLHFERSPMYHLRMLYLMLLLRNAGTSALSAMASRQLPKMRAALQRMCHPDGGIALVNDSAFGIYHEPQLLLDWSAESRPLHGEEATSPSLPPGHVAEATAWALPDAGYYGAHTPEGHALICDAGPIGPDYIPGHAHADIFSFELSLEGHRVIVDSGVYDYLVSDRRRYCRSTAAHNTVTINDSDQCELWGAFRVARRGHPHDVHWRSHDEGFELAAWHDGYHRLPGQPSHRRTFSWHHSGRLEVTDQIDAASDAATWQAASYLHFHPTCRLHRITGTEALVQTPAGQVQLTWSGDGALYREEGLYCPRFGHAIPHLVLVFRSSGTHLHHRYTLQWRGENR